MQIPRKVKIKDDFSLDHFAAHLYETHGEQPETLVASAVSDHGARFVIPVLVPYTVATGDGRKFLYDSLSIRDLPLPLMWQFKSSTGHDQSVLVGRIDEAEVSHNGIVQVRGVFDTGVYGVEAERLVRNGFLRGVSADMDNFQGTEQDIKAMSDKVIRSRPIHIDAARMAGATLVNIPAFQRARIYLEDEEFGPVEEAGYTMLDGEFSSDYEEAALVASAYPVAPPKSWFEAPNTSVPGPIEISDEGQVSGYLALWESTHIGVAGNVRPPRNTSKYKYFRTGKVITAEGDPVYTGSLTLVGGHAPMHFNAKQAVGHYDNTASSVIDVSAGEDNFGIWIAGALRPDVTPSQLRSMRASGISGDWRPINGRLELVRACFVNTPGFMTTRALVSSGQVQSLVAAGTGTLEQMRHDSVFSGRFQEHLDGVVGRLDYLENREKYDQAHSKLSLAREQYRALEQQKLDDKVKMLKAKFNNK